MRETLGEKKKVRHQITWFRLGTLATQRKRAQSVVDMVEDRGLN